MFWKLTLFTSHVDTLLDKEDVTLQEVLDEDDVLQECKAQNQKLIDFLVRPEHIEELVNLTTREPEEDKDEKIRYKYPNIACELLTSDVSQINDKLAEEDSLLSKIYAFMESEDKMNPLLASFFSKVMGLLIARKSEKMLEFLKSKEDFVGQLLHHLGTSAIMDLLLRLITCIESTECRNQAISWLNEHQLVQRLVAMIDPAHSEEKQCNASQTLCDIIRLSREQMSQLQEKADIDPLLTLIESEDTVADLLSHMFDGQSMESVMISGLSVIQTLLEFKRTGPEGCSEQMTELDADRLAQGVNNTLRALEKRLKDLHSVLVEPPRQYFSNMPTTIGNLEPPLGNTRLQVVKLITTLLQTNSPSINEELSRLGTTSVLLDLYFKYIWNNFLHTQVEQIVQLILSNPPIEGSEEQELPLLNQLFTESRLIQRIIDGWEENESTLQRPDGRRRGYMGHLTKIANHVTETVEKGNNSEKVKNLIKGVPEEYGKKWETFVSETLAEVNKKNTVELVGGHHLHSSSDDEDADFRDIPIPQDSAMQQAFSDYQLQQMTSTFIDQFGFSEEEFSEQEERVDGPFTDRISSINFDINSTEDNPNAAALFQQACNQRMQQFDDPNTEEALWDEKEITFSQGADSRPSSMHNTGRRRTQETTDSDGSSDSDEELDSPSRIYQAASSNTEKMDIDNSDNVAPIAMDTQSPWDNSSSQMAEDRAQDVGWAKFDKGVTASPSELAKNGQDDNWADFDKFTSIGSTSLPVTDPGPRSSSPVAMDTGDTTQSDRTSAYLVSSAPADLGAEVTSSETPANASAKVEPSLPTSPAATSQDTQNSINSPAAVTSPANNSTSPSSGSPQQPVVEPPEKPSSDAENGSPPETPRGPPPSKKDLLQLAEESSADATKDHSLPESEDDSKLNSEDVEVPSSTQINDDEYDEDDIDLMDNFSFLSSAGLMKVDSEQKSGGDADQTQRSSSEADSNAQADARVAEAREKAKEALDLYQAATSPGTPSVQNGPV